MFAKTLVIPATANGLALRVGVVADSFYVVSCSENLNVQVFRGSTMVDNITNFPCGNLGQDYAEEGGFTRLEIQTNSGNPGSITLLCGDAKTTYAALSGTVTVQDTSSGIYNAINGFAFSGATTQALVAGQKAFAKLRNPVGSGINIYIKRIRCQCAAGATVGQYDYSVDVTDYTVSAAVGSKLLGSGITPKAVLSTGTNVAGGDAGMTQFGGEVVQSTMYGTLDCTDKEYIIKPGSAFILRETNNAQDLQTMWEWLEK